MFDTKYVQNHYFAGKIYASNICSQLRDKAKHTAALIQEITEELQAIEEESIQEDQNSDATQLSNLEQDDSDIPLNKDEQ